MKQFIELRENLRKQIAQMASKFPEGSKVKMKHGGIGTVLSVTKDSVKVGVGNKTMNHKPSELVAIAKKESVDDMQEKYNQKFPPELIAKAVKLALLMGGNMTGAVNKIEKMKKGLSKDQNVANALRLANESDTTQAFKKIVAESWGKNYESLCAAMKLNPIQSEILKDYLDRGQIKSQYVGKAAGDVKASRIYASKKPYVGSTTNRKEALYNAMKLNLKQQKILDKYISSGNVIGKYQGSMAGTTKETQKYAGMKNFKEHNNLDNLIKGKM